MIVPGGEPVVVTWCPKVIKWPEARLVESPAKLYSLLEDVELWTAA